MISSRMPIRKLLKITNLTPRWLVSFRQLAKTRATFVRKLARCLGVLRLARSAVGSRLECQEIDLKRFLSIFSDRIFDSSVDRGMPNLAAAPVAPNTRPRLSFRAASIMLFSCATRV